MLGCGRSGRCFIHGSPLSIRAMPWRSAHDLFESPAEQPGPGPLRTGRKPVRAATKTARSRRTIPLDGATIVALRAHRTGAIEAALATGHSYDTAGWVFRRSRGEGPLTMSIVWK